MAQSRTEKRKAKRKAKQKQRRIRQTEAIQKANREFLLDDAIWLRESGDFYGALANLNKLLRHEPDNEAALIEMGLIGKLLNRHDLELKALLKLYDTGRLTEKMRPVLCTHLMQQNRLQEAQQVAEEGLSRLQRSRLPGKRDLKTFYTHIQSLAVPPVQPEVARRQQSRPAPLQQQHESLVKDAGRPAAAAQPVQPKPASTIQPITVSIEIDDTEFRRALTAREFSSPQQYDVALQGQLIRLKETFERLVCFSTLKNVHSLQYQEETARKVLKRFRGRALLADEVGLGKTIEALMVLKEYFQRGMIQSALILTPASLVGQWTEELQDKFGLEFPSTDGQQYRSLAKAFWDEPFVVASINLAKSKKNYSRVVAREWDLVIVDEAHHLKNRTTLNWKLVNELKKRFLLLLTATPVENNLMELYNLITLLKPGQLKTAGEFRKEFMTRGDPTDPQNRTKLRELLGEVMIRNTRAVARIEIPARFAQTVRVDPTASEQELYGRITTLVQLINRSQEGGNQLLLRILLEEAGSSPRAVSLTLSRLLAKNTLLSEQEQEIRAINNLCRTMGNSGKNKLLLDLIRSSSEKMIVFVKYLGTLQYLSEFLTWEGIDHAVFHGGLSGAQKEDQIRRFEADTAILVATEVGGEGRNLQFCHRMVNYDLPWNPMKIEQRVGRIHRIGQQNEVLIYNLCGSGSAEDYILEILDKKINMFEMVIGEIDMILGRIKGDQEFPNLVLDIWLNAATEDERAKAFGRLGGMLKRLKNSYEKTKTLDEKLFGENYES